METLIRELRFASRRLRNSPGFTIIAISTLTLGIAATVAVFSIFDAVVLKPLPFPNPEKLVAIAELRTIHGTTAPSPVSYPNFLDWRRQNHVFESIASYRPVNVTMTGATEPVHIEAAIVAADFFKVLGAPCSLGRGFLPEEERSGTRVVVLSDEIWHSAFNANPHVLGQTIGIDGETHTIIGVMPAKFEFPYPQPKIWMALAEDVSSPLFTLRGAHSVRVIGRLRPETSISQAREQMNLLARTLADSYPDTNATSRDVEIISEQELLTKDIKANLIILLGAVAAVLLITCSNIANLSLARATGRKRELAVRAALGATKWQAARQLLMESCLLSLFGTTLGVILAGLTIKSLLHLYPNYVAQLQTITLDFNVLLLAAGLSVITTMLFGLVPAISALRTQSVLNNAERTVKGKGTTRQRRMQALFVVTQTALGVILVICAGLLLRSFAGLMHTDLGFNSHNVLTFKFDLVNRETKEQIRFYRVVLQELRSMPSVTSAAGVIPLPLSGDRLGTSFEIQGRPVAQSDRPTANLGVATPEYFKTLDIPVLEGRDFSEADGENTVPVVIINQIFAEQYFAGQDAVGKFIKPDFSLSTDTPWRQIVGIVGNIRRRSIRTPGKAEFYLPYSQALFGAMPIIVRTQTQPLAMSATVRQKLKQVDPQVAVYDVLPLDHYVDGYLADPRFQAFLISSFAIFALVLSALGLYGVVTQTVLQERSELAVRMALGATRPRILSMVLAKGVKLTTLGLFIGVAGAFYATKFLASMLYGVKPADPITFAAVCGLLLLVSLLSCYLPAYRAATIDPVTVLHES